MVTTYRFRVVRNDNVATFIKELVLEPEPGSPTPQHRPGEYLQFDIPAYEEICLREIAVNEPFGEIWRSQGLLNVRAQNRRPIRRNFSMASNPSVDKLLRFNVRLSLPQLHLVPGTRGTIDSSRSQPDLVLEGALDPGRLPLRLRIDGTVERPQLLQIKGAAVQIDVTRSRHLDAQEQTAALALALSRIQELESRLAVLEDEAARKEM